MKSPPAFCEFSRRRLVVAAGAERAELPLERRPDGGLTDDCVRRVQPALKQFFKTAGCTAQTQAFCAIDARGVSLRCLLLPPVAEAGMRPLVRMQIETEFPLPPDDLAWGCELRGGPVRQADGSAKQPVLVAAVKKDFLEQYSGLAAGAGVVPVFTLSALARAALCAGAPPAFAVVEAAPDQCELAGFEGSAKAFVRSLPAANSSDGASVDALAKAVQTLWAGPKLYILGPPELAAQVARQMPAGYSCEHLRTASGEESSAVISGLKQLVAERGTVPLELQVRPPAAVVAPVRPALVQWAVRAALLLVAVLCFPGFEALLFTAPLAKDVSAFESKATNVEATVDHELRFLQDLKIGQPPYLEAIYIVCKAAPPGVNLESLSFNRRGEMALRGSLRSGDQVSEFRSKLIASGYFSSVTVEDQTPGQQKVTVRMTGQLKPLAQLLVVPVGPTAAELATNALAAAEDSAPRLHPAGAKNGAPHDHQTTNSPGSGGTNHP